MAGNGTGTGPGRAAGTAGAEEARTGGAAGQRAARGETPGQQAFRRTSRGRAARTGGAAGQRAARGGETPEQQAFRRDEPGPEPPRTDKRRYFVLMGVCIALFVVSWAVVDRYSVLAAIIMSAVALVIPPLAAIVANVASATDRRRP